MNVLKIEQINLMSLSHHHYLALMGIQVWHEKQFSLSCTQQAEDLGSLCTKSAHCIACDPHKTCTQTVFGTGNPNADLIIISSAPDFDEDQKGQPWQLLDLMLQSIS